MTSAEVICGKAAKRELTGLGGASFYPHLAGDGWSLCSPRGSCEELKDGRWALGWQEQRPGPPVMSLTHLPVLDGSSVAFSI